MDFHDEEAKDDIIDNDDVETEKEQKQTGGAGKIDCIIVFYLSLLNSIVISKQIENEKGVCIHESKTRPKSKKQPKANHWTSPK